MAEKKDGSAILVVLGGALVAFLVIAVLIAVAVPATLRWLKATKASEAETITRRIARAAQKHWGKHCEFPPALPPHADPAHCCGGEKCTPDSDAARAWEAIDIEITDATYFSYRTELQHNENGPTYAVIGTADFECGGPRHTFIFEIHGKKRTDGTCRADGTPPRVEHVFE